MTIIYILLAVLFILVFGAISTTGETKNEIENLEERVEDLEELLSGQRDSSIDED